MSVLWDDMGDQEVQHLEADSFHKVPFKDDKPALEWLNMMVEALQKQAITRNSIIRSNFTAYRGNQTMPKRNDSRSSERQYKTTKIEKFVVNHLYNMTETKVSQMMRLKPAVDVMPSTGDYEDRNAAKVTKSIINHLWYINNIDKLLENIHRIKTIGGEVFAFVEWNKDKGDLHPAIKDGIKQDGKVFLNDGQGGIAFDDNGEGVELETEAKIGDIEYSLEYPWRVLLQRKSQCTEVEYCFRIRVIPTDDLHKDYPNKAGQIKNESDIKQWSIDTLKPTTLEKETIVYEFFHKATKYVPQGRFIKFTKDVVLENEVLPYSHGNLPFERLTDIDVPEVLNGISRYEFTKPIQNMHNNLSTLLAKNIYLTGHAKWVMPRGACKIDQLGNDNTVVQYQGPVPPQLLQVNPNPPEAYSFRDSLKDEQGQVFGVGSTARGEPPKGITAGVALQFLNEQESERANSDIAKHNSFVQRLARKTLAVCGDYYQPDDGRMVRIVGKGEEDTIKHFDSANLNKDYDIRVQNGSALPESKAAKTQRIIEMMQYKQDLLSNERWLDLLEIGNVDKMNSLLTEAVKAADSENEDLLAGLPVGEPEEWENHIIHWQAHSKIIQRRSFKEELPEEIRESMLDHIETTEFAMIEKAAINPLFESKLAQLELFPILYQPGQPPRSREHQEAMVQGQANRGEEVTGAIPAEEALDETTDLKGEE